MKLSDFSQAPSGLFLLNVFRRGKLIEVFEEKNLIVNNSKQIHANLLGGNTANQSLTQIAYGTNSTAASATDTAITAPYYKPFDSVTYPASNQVQFNFSLGTTEDNGVTIWEFGLLTPTNVLYARKVRSAGLAKASDLSLTGSWTISF